jgi:hypothetical protein
MCEFISEANNYPYSTYSDMVMAWWFARQGMQKYWYIPERGKADSEEDEFGEDGTFLPPDLVSMLENTGDYAN